MQPCINLLHKIQILSTSPMKSSYTAAIIKMIFYLQGLKAILNHESASEQGIPSLWDQCMKWKYSQGLWGISIYSVCDPALGFSVQGMLPGLHSKSSDRQLGASFTTRTTHAGTQDGLSPGCWAVPRVLGTQSSSGTSAEGSTSTRCAPLGTKDTQSHLNE